MFRDLRVQVSPARRILAVALLILALAGAAALLVRQGAPPFLLKNVQLLVWVVGGFLTVRLFAYLLLDPLLSDPRTAVPGFARDLVVLGLYAGGAVLLLHRVGGINLAALLGTGAIAAAVVGLSLQETLGNLFAGIAMHLEDAFRVGDWIEVTGNLRGGPGRETFVGQVEATTWRTLQLRTENGDTDIIPNRTIAQAVVTNLYVPSGLHRRTLKVIVEPHPELHLALEALIQALGGIPHYPAHKPEVVAHSFDMGGVVLEVRWWALGWRHGRAANFQAARLIASVLPRLGLPLLGPHGATTPHPPVERLDEAAVREVLARIGLSPDLAPELKEHIHLRRLVPGEGVIREGDPGQSLFMVMDGSLQVVKVMEKTEPYTGLFWDVLAELGPGQWFGEASVLTGAPRNATVVAATACGLVEIPKLGFERCLKRDPRLLEGLLDLVEARAAEQHHPDRQHPGREVWLAQMKRWFRL
jgi:small-conductance mechanosensitive channel